MQLITSPSLSALESHLLEHIHRQKKDDPFQPTVILSASNLLGRYLARELVKRGIPHLATYFLTFADLACALTRRSLIAQGRLPLPQGGKTVLTWKLVRNLTVDSYFAAVREQPRLPSVLESTFTDIEDSRIDIAIAVDTGKRESSASERKLREVADLFEMYRKHLGDRFLVEADLLVEAAKAGRNFRQFFGADTLYVYGFYDLTGAQLETVGELSRHIDLVVFLLVGEDNRFRFAHSLRDVLRGWGAQEEALDSEPAGSNLEVLRKCVFTPGQSSQPPDQSLRIFSCPNEVIEAREIAREAVRLKKEEGVPFCEMAVVLRDAERYIPLICSTFEKIGLPYYVREGLPLARTPSGKSILALLHLPEGDYRRFDVMEWLTQGAVDPRSMTPGETVAPVTLWDRMSIEAGVVEGEGEWRKQLQGLLDGYAHELGTTSEEKRRGLEYRRQAAQDLLALLVAIFGRLRQLAQQRNWSDLCRQTVELLCDYYFPSPDRDEIQDAIESLASLDTLGEPVEFKEFLSMLESVLVGTSKKIGELQQTGIHILSLTAARYARFRVVFLPGLMERSFPLRGRQDPILLDRERERLSAARVGSLPLKATRHLEERLLFLLALESARERIVLSFPRTEALAGAERIPSYYVLRVCECFADRTITYADLAEQKLIDPRVRYIENTRILSVEAKSCLDEREFDLNAVNQRLKSDAPDTARYLEYFSASFGFSLQGQQALWGTNRLTAYDGALSSAACLEELVGLFGEDRIFSPTALERYAACPYHFFLENVLRLEVLQEPETIERLEPMELGTLVHQILSDFYQQMKGEGRLPLARVHFDRYREALDEICVRRYAETEAKGITGYPLMWVLTRKSIRQDLERHLLAEIDRGGEWMPQELEREFGFGGTGGLTVQIGNLALLLRGKIDRIDVTPDRKRIRVTDYKTGRRKTGDTVDLDGGRKLQLPLYLLAATQLYGGMVLDESSAEYCYVSRAGSWEPSTFEGRALAEKQESLSKIIETILTGCRNGVFPRHPENPSYPRCQDCDFKMIGDPRHKPLWDRKRSDPRLAGFLEMKEIK